MPFCREDGKIVLTGKVLYIIRMKDGFEFTCPVFKWSPSQEVEFMQLKDCHRNDTTFTLGGKEYRGRDIVSSRPAPLDTLVDGLPYPWGGPLEIFRREGATYTAE